jgi:hypothetical protein
MLFAYLTQLKLLNEPWHVKPKVSHGWLLCVAVILLVFSIACFAIGSWQAVARFGGVT